MRVDESEYTTRAKLEYVGVDIVEGNPIDLCYSCYYKLNVEDDVDHPDYDETDPVYYCAICGTPLTSADN